MVCTRPVPGYRAPNGQITSSRSRGYVDLPVTRPCGGCRNCRLEYSRQWAMRIMHEASLYKNNIFVTLTYRDADLPEHDSLVLDHWKLFMKRLKKRHGGAVIRFYHCGEYGDETHRPHYHAILFNFDLSDRSFHKKTETGSLLYTSAKLDEIWRLGNCYIGDVTFESAAYCARYVMKKLTGARKSEYGSRLPEYSTQSRKPGVGSPWLAKWKTDVFPNDFCILNGRKVRVPKSYDRLMALKETPLGEWVEDHTGFPLWRPSIKSTPMEMTKRLRIRSASKHTENQTRERLDVIEEVTELRVQRLTRSLK